MFLPSLYHQSLKIVEIAPFGGKKKDTVKAKEWVGKSSIIYFNTAAESRSQLEIIYLPWFNRCASPTESSLFNSKRFVSHAEEFLAIENLIDNLSHLSYSVWMIYRTGRKGTGKNSFCTRLILLECLNRLNSCFVAHIRLIVI